MMDIQKILRKSSLSKKVWSSLTIVSVCFRIIKKHFALSELSEMSGHIRHNILFISNTPREVTIWLYKEKNKLLDAINKELAVYDFRYTLKDIRTK